MKDKLGLYAQRLEDCKLILNAPMKEYTSFRIGGPADIMVIPRSAEELSRSIAAAEEMEMPYLIMGNGTNLLVSDEGIKGAVIRIAGDFSGIEYRGNIQKVLSGTPMSTAAKDAAEHGFMGLEWAAGIPGTAGGAVAMNAGAYGGEIKQRLVRVRCMEDGSIVERIPKDGDLDYRFSRFCAPDSVVVSAELELLPDDGLAKARMRDYSQRRREKQPLSHYSAGSTFKRPKGHFAGELIENAGLKGFSVGGAQVSTLHAGFVINRGGATCDDVRRLMRHVQETVYRCSGIELEPEVKFIGRC